MIQKIKNSPPVQGLKRLLQRIILPGFDGLPLYDVGRFLVDGIVKGDVLNTASAISFRLFLALFPTVILILSIIPFIPIDGFQDKLLFYFAEVLPENAFASLEETLNDLITHRRVGILSFGFLLTLFFASNSINAILGGFNRSYYQELRRHPIRQRLLSVVIMVILTVLVVAAISIVTLSGSFFTYLQTEEVVEGKFLFALLHVAKWTAIIILFLASISILYNFGTPKKHRNGWQVISAGSTLATLSCIGVSLLFEMFVNTFGTYNKLYGSIGTLVVILVWIYLNMVILLIGYDLNKSIQMARRKRAEE